MPGPSAADGRGRVGLTLIAKKKVAICNTQEIMKKVFLFLVVPFAALAIELHPEQECETLKNILITDLTQYYSQSVNIVENSRRIKTYANSLQNRNDFMVGGSDYALIQSINSSADEVIRHSSAVSNQTSYLLGVVSNVVCSACPVDDSGDSSCCDDVISLLQSISQDTASISLQLDDTLFLLEQIDDNIAEVWAVLYRGINDITNTLNYADFLLQHGFYDTTNSLLSIQTTFTNRFDLVFNYSSATADKYSYYMSGNTLTTQKRDWWSSQRTNKAFYPRDWGTMTSLYYIGLDNFLQLGSLNNFFNDFSFNRFPILTNTVGAIHRDVTNFFSFFRGEIGVHSVLEDWTNVEADGTYYEYLTNHYISVVKGGPLSGNSSTKTNWFSRIETLLASLVFLDSSNTNAYDSASESVSNEVDRVKDSFNSTIDGVSSSPGIQMELAADIERSMYQSLLAFSKAFSSASLPSSVQLLHVSKTSGSRSLSLSSDVVDVTVSVDGKLMDFVEVIRSATTLCWVFFGLWFMFKFSVWTVKKIYMLIRYIIDFFNMVAGGK